jgi:hypothetical protein
MKKFLVSLILAGTVYTGFCLSPSSYAWVLENSFHVKKHDQGLILGRTRAIRSDEFAHFTPWTQAVVKNNFERYNANSIYKEDFRTVFPMPIRDWAITFKPAMWLYFITKPETAFSFYWYFSMACSLFGWAMLLKKLGFDDVTSIGASFIIFFSSFVQYWWTNNSGTFAFFPLVILAFFYFMDSPGVKQSLFFFWISTVWLLALFYPPFIIELGFVGFVIILVNIDKYEIKKIISVLALGISSVGLAGWYLKDELISISQSPLQGLRVLSGGSMQLRQFASHFFPFINYSNHESIIGSNICELSVVGSILCFSIFFIKPFKTSEGNSPSCYFRRLTILLLGLILIICWELFPISPSFGRLFLWDRIPPNRMGYASGVLLILIILFTLKEFHVRINSVRCIAAAFVYLLTFFMLKFSKTHKIGLEEICVLTVFGLGLLYALLFQERNLISSSIGIKRILVLAAAVPNILVFGGFNPLQSTKTIFEKPKTLVLEKLDMILEQQGGQILAVPSDWGFAGATLTGYGYPSVSHAMFAPHLNLWKKYFPNIEEKKFREIFLRSAHIVVERSTEPRVLQSNVIAVPFLAFANYASLEVPYISQLKAQENGFWQNLNLKQENGSNALGFIDSLKIEKNQLIIDGWAIWWDHNLCKTFIITGINEKMISYKISKVERVDVAKIYGNDYLNVGFKIEALFDDKISPKKDSANFYLINKAANKYIQLPFSDQPSKTKIQL